MYQCTKPQQNRVIASVSVESAEYWAALIHSKFKQIADAPVSQHVDCLLSPRPQSAVSEWFLLFTKNHWTAWRKCVQPERRVGNASIHLFVFHRKQFWRQSCKKMASPQLGNRDSQNKFARKLSKVCHSRDMRILEYNIYRWAPFLAPIGPGWRWKKP